MKPWMWAALGAVVVIIITIAAYLALVGETPAPEPPVAVVEPTDPPSAPAPVEPPPPAPVDEMPDLFAGLDTDALAPGPDLRPEHVEREEFDEVFDEVIETCGLGDWTELNRACTDWRCTALVAAASEGEEHMMDVNDIVGCPAWKDTWGPQADWWVFGVECDDGTVLHLSLMGPSTKKMIRGIDQGFIEEFQVDLEAERERACAQWGT